MEHDERINLFICNFVFKCDRPLRANTFKIAMRWGCSEEEFKDIMQDSYANFIENLQESDDLLQDFEEIDDNKGIKKAFNYIRVIALRKIFKTNKERARRAGPLPNDIVASPIFFIEKDAGKVRDAVGSLPEFQREVLTKRLEGKSNQKIADELGLTASIVASRINKSLPKLRKFLGEDFLKDQ